MPADLQIYYAILAAVFGVVLGSFLNVCIYRIPRDISVVAPRSFCPECGKQIAWHDNIPVLSYAFLRGRCRFCAERIGMRYPIVEITTGCLFAAVALRYGWSLVALKWAVFEALLVILFWTDFEEQILPDELTLGGTAVGLIFAVWASVPGVLGELFFPGWKPVWQSLFNAVLGIFFLAGPIWFTGIVYTWVRKREGLGFGDVKLLMLMGAFLGLENGLLALLIGAVSGSAIGLAYVLLTRKKFAETELPFGSFLCVGAIVMPLVKSL